MKSSNGKKHTAGYVLIADDDDDVCTLLGIILKPLALEIRYAGDGYEVLNLVAEEHPSLIILDLQMPHLNGIEVLEKLSGTPNTSNIPIIVYSNLVKPAYRNGNGLTVWPAQVVDVLEKRTHPATIRELVKKVCAG